MGIAYGSRVGSTHGTTGPATVAITLSGAVNVGELIVINVMANSPTVTTDLAGISDTAGNTYTSGWHGSDGGNIGGYVWYCMNAKALAIGNTITITMPTSWAGFGYAITVDRITGAATASVNDGANHNATVLTATTGASGNITTTTAGDLLWGFVAGLGTDPLTFPSSASSPSTGWTNLANVADTSGDDCLASYQIVAAAGTYAVDATVTSAAWWFIGIIAFKPATGGGTINGSCTLQGNSNLALNSQAWGAITLQGNAATNDSSIADATSDLTGNAILQGTSDSLNDATLSGNAVLLPSSESHNAASLIGNAILQATPIADGNEILAGNAILQAAGLYQINAKAFLTGNANLLGQEANAQVGRIMYHLIGKRFGRIQ